MQDEEQEFQDDLPDEPIELGESDVDASQYGGQTPASRRIVEREPPRDSRKAKSLNKPKPKPLEEHTRVVKRKPQSSVVTDPYELKMLNQLRLQRDFEFQKQAQRQFETQTPVQRRTDLEMTDPGWSNMAEMRVERPVVRAQPQMDADEYAAIQTVRKAKQEKALRELNGNVKPEVVYKSDRLINGVSGLLYLGAGAFAGMASTSVRAVPVGDVVMYTIVGALMLVFGAAFQYVIGPRL